MKLKEGVQVPAMITWDVDPVAVDRNKEALDFILQMLDALQVPSTFFFTAHAAKDLRNEISALAGKGHEIGCHGLTHGYEEEYNRMPEKMQRDYLFRATHILEDITGMPIRSFRGPRVKTSCITQGILEELGYWSDCSVASQRIDFVSSNLINPGWIFAPRLPYHPALQNPFRKGGRKLWVIPISALIFPFISSALYVFGSKFMKRFFNVLYRESQLTGKPIVYLAHPYEFALHNDNGSRTVSEASFKHRIGISFAELTVRGFRFRYKFYEQNFQRRIQMTRDLLHFMCSHSNLRFMLIKEYISMLPDQTCGQ